MPKYWITKPHYLKQTHDAVPHYVDASPNRPVLVSLPDDVGPSSMMKEEAKAPELPMTGFVKKVSTVTKPGPTEAKKSGKRAADE